MEKERLTTRQRREGKYPVIVLTGEIDVFTAPTFKGAVYEPILEGFRHIIVDLSGVSYMDSSGFGILLGAAKRVRPEAGTVSLVGCNDMISRMLTITQLSTVFNLTKTLEEAIQAIEAAESP